MKVWHITVHAPLPNDQLHEVFSGIWRSRPREQMEMKFLQYYDEITVVKVGIEFSKGDNNFDNDQHFAGYIYITTHKHSKEETVRYFYVGNLVEVKD